MASKDEKKLFDLLTRHQVYLEGLKLGFAAQFLPYLRELDNELRQLFARLEYENLGELTKRELKAFLKSVRKSQRSIYNRYNTQITEQSLEFMKINVDVTRDIYTDIEDMTPEEANESKKGAPILGIKAFNGKASGDALLWASISNTPIPATGETPPEFLAAFIANSMVRIESAILKGYANKYSVAETLRLIRGSKRLNYKDGQLHKINNNSRAVTATTLQHNASIVQVGIRSLFYPRYQWVSVLDGRTSDICLSRSNKIYTFGKGPIPPAHPNCRSKIVPTFAKEAEYKQTYYAWIRLQPKAVQNDILGEVKAKALRSGELTAKDFPKFVESKKISLEEFSEKRKLIKD